jgi:general secretion pathway protein A
MYERFFGLRERPFDLTPNPRFLVMTERHREALSNLEYAIAARKGITLLLGEAGCGKTTVIRTALDRQSSRVHCVHITNPALTRNEFVETLATEFGLSAAARQSKAALLAELEAMLRRRREADETTVLVIDEAQSLSTDLLEEIRLLANIETADEKLISLILAGQPELAEHLNRESLRQFKQRIALRCELRPLSTQETLAYLAGRVRAAGGVASRIFTREAATLLHEHSRGIPRLVNVLADNALLAAFGRQTPQVTSQLVLEIARDFHLTSTTPETSEAAPSETASPEIAPADAVAPAITGEQKATGSTETLLMPVQVAESEQIPAPSDPEPVEEPGEAALFGTFSARRRFSFFGRRGHE